MSMEIATDKCGNIKSWSVIYCGWETANVLIDKNEPFKLAHISAHTAEDAVRILKRELCLARIDVVGAPTLELISREEYENG